MSTTIRQVDDIEQRLKRFDAVFLIHGVAEETATEWSEKYVDNSGKCDGYWAIIVEWSSVQDVSRHRVAALVAKHSMDYAKQRKEQLRISGHLWRTQHDINDEGRVRVIYYAQIK